MLRALPAEFAAELARTPIGMLALDIVEIGRRFVDTVTAECSDDAPPADGTGGSAHRVMVVAGINSSGLAGDRGPTGKLDVGALGYRRTDGEVRYYSYAADGGPYVPEDTLQDLEVSGHLLAEQLRAMQREQPGREVDLIAHSQGGVVVDVFLHNDYARGRPHVSADRHGGHALVAARRGAARHGGGADPRLAAGTGRARRGRAMCTARSRASASPAVRRLSERSQLIADIQRRGVPEHIDFTSIGATRRLGRSRHQHLASRRRRDHGRGQQPERAHHAIVQDPAALRAVRAALEGRAPPCVGIDTALRGAIAPGGHQPRSTHSSATRPPARSRGGTP